MNGNYVGYVDGRDPLHGFLSTIIHDQMRDQPQMRQDQQVWLHGDAAPANFLFGDGMAVAAIMDLRDLLMILGI